VAAEDLFAFLEAVGAELARHAVGSETLDLHLLGRSALILGYGVRLMTKDVDVVDIAGSRLLAIAVQVFGKGGPVSASTWRPSPRGFRRCRSVIRAGASTSRVPGG